MNKFLTKIATAFVGMTMAIGVGIALGANWEVQRADAVDPTVTYTIASTESVTSNDAPSGTSATFSTTYSNKNQLTGGNSMTVTLSGYGGKTISGITLSMKSNSKSGSGTLKYKIGTGADVYIIGSSTTNIAFNNDAWYGSWSKSYANVVKTGLDIEIDGNKDFALTISAAANSLYCQSFTFSYHDTQSQKETQTIDSFNVTSTGTYTRGATPSISDWTVVPVLDDGSTPKSISDYISFKTTPSTATIGSIDVTLVYNATNGPYNMSTGISSEISTTMTVNPVQATVGFKQDTYTIAPEGTLTLADEVTQTGDGDLTFSITAGGSYVSLSNDDVLTATAIGQATIKVVKQYGNYTDYKAEATATVNVSNVTTWKHVFESKEYSAAGDATLTASTGSTDTDSKIWTASVTTGAIFSYDNNNGKGQQFGSGNNPSYETTLSTSGFEAASEIQTVKVNASKAVDSDAVLSLLVGGKNYTTLDSNSQEVTSISLTTTATEYTFTGSEMGSINQETSKAVYVKSIEVTYDNSPIEQGGIKASWATGKGTYYNGSKTATNTFSTADLIINTITDSGKTYGDANTTGKDFKTYVKSGEKWLKDDKTLSDTEVVFKDSTSSETALTQSLSGFTAGTYKLYVTTVRDSEQGTVWTSEQINLVITAKAPSTVTPSTAVADQEYIAYVDAFTAYAGKLSVAYNDTDTASELTPAIKYFNGDDEVASISTLLNSDNTFKVSSNTTLTVKLYDPSYVGGDYVFASYTIYVYAASNFAVSDGNGDNVEYSSGATVALNPSATLKYTDKTSTQQTANVAVSSLNLTYKVKDSSDTPVAYTGTLPTVTDTTYYTIIATHKVNASFTASYDIKVVNATFSVSTTKSTYSFGENFDKTKVAAQIQYGSADPTAVSVGDLTFEYENGDEVGVIKYIGAKTIIVRYGAYQDTLEITGTNVGSTTANIHDDIPGEWEVAENATSSSTSDLTTSLASGSRLTKDKYISKPSAFGENVAGKIVVNISLSHASGGTSTSFGFKVVGKKGADDTTYESDVSSITSSTTSTAHTFTLDNIPYSAGIDGWKLLCVSKENTSASNLNWTLNSVNYYAYAKGEDQTFNATPAEQAAAMRDYLAGFKTCQSGWAQRSDVATLAAEYNGLVPEAKTAFASLTLTDYDWENADEYYDHAYVGGEPSKAGVNALDKLKEMVDIYNKTLEGEEEALVLETPAGDFTNLSVNLVKSLMNTEVSSSTILLLIVSFLGVTAVAGYFLLKRRKEN